MPKRLTLRVKVRRHPTRPGRLLVKARCSTGCKLRVELSSRLAASRAVAARVTTVAARTSRFSRRAQTLSISFAKGLDRGSRRITIKITAITGGGQTATRFTSVRLRPTGFLAAKSGFVASAA